MTEPTMRELLELLEDARQYVLPTTGTHEDISTVLGWCDCGYCVHVPKQPSGQEGGRGE